MTEPTNTTPATVAEVMAQLAEADKARAEPQLTSRQRRARTPENLGRLREQLVLGVEEAADALAGRRAARIRAAEARPGLLLEVRQLLDEQLLLAAHVAVDRARPHAGALGDRALDDDALGQ